VVAVKRLPKGESIAGSDATVSALQIPEVVAHDAWIWKRGEICKGWESQGLIPPLLPAMIGTAGSVISAVFMV